MFSHKNTSHSHSHSHSQKGKNVFENKDNESTQYVRRSIFPSHLQTTTQDHFFLDNVPLKSPYPDCKRANIISSTKSPEKYDIQRKIYFSNSRKVTSRIFESSNSNSNQSKNDRFTQKKNKKNGFIDTQQTQKNELAYAFANNQSQLDLKKECKKKDLIITELKKIINAITQNQRYVANQRYESNFQMIIKQKQNTPQISCQQEKSFQNDVKILTLENQKLLTIIDKLQNRERQRENQLKKSRSFRNSKRSQEKDEIIAKLTEEINQLKTQIGEFQSQIKEEDFSYQKQLKLALQEKQRLQKIVKANSNGSQSQQQYLREIKSQHQKSLMQFKVTVSQEIQSMFETIELTFSEINSKLNKVERKLASLEQDQETIIGKHRQAFKEKNQKENEELFAMEAVMKRQKKLHQQQVQALNEQIRSIRETQRNHQDKNSESQRESLKQYYEKLLNEKTHFIQSQRQKWSVVQKSKDSQISELQDNYAKKIQNAFDIKDRQIEILNESHRKQLIQIKGHYENQVQTLKKELLIKNVSIKELRDQKFNTQSLLMQKFDSLQKLADHAERQYKKDKQFYQGKVFSQQGELAQLGEVIKRMNEQLKRNEKDKENWSIKMRELVEEINKMKQQKENWQINSKGQVQLIINETRNQIDQLNGRYQKLAFQLLEKNKLLSIFEIQKKRLAEGYQQNITTFSQQIRKLNQKISEKDEELERLANETKRLRFPEIRDELKQMRKLVEIQQFYRIQAQINKVSKMYDELLVEVQEKIFLLNKISSENLQLKESLSVQIRRTEQAELKINQLQKVHVILQTELRRRKQSSEKLISQKCLLQKQLLYLKESLVKLQAKSATQNSDKMSKLILNKINALLEIQLSKERQFQSQY